MYAAQKMWARSVDLYSVRYSTMLSDGDGKSHAKVNGDPYPVSKEECINHVHKRLSYHLFKVSKLAARDNIRTGGRSPGQLTEQMIKTLSSYYGSAVSIYI